MIMKRLSLLLFLLASVTGFAQARSTAFIRTGLRFQPRPAAAKLRLERSFAALREARGLFLPSVTLLADYTYADGGRKSTSPWAT